MCVKNAALSYSGGQLNVKTELNPRRFSLVAETVLKHIIKIIHFLGSQRSTAHFIRIYPGTVNLNAYIALYLDIQRHAAYNPSPNLFRVDCRGNKIFTAAEYVLLCLLVIHISELKYNLRTHINGVFRAHFSFAVLVRVFFVLLLRDSLFLLRRRRLFRIREPLSDFIIIRAEQIFLHIISLGSRIHFCLLFLDYFIIALFLLIMLSVCRLIESVLIKPARRILFFIFIFSFIFFFIFTVVRAALNMQKVCRNTY